MGMQSKILLPIAVLLTIAVIAITSISYYLEREILYEEINGVVKVKVTEVKRGVKIQNEEIVELKKDLDKSCIIKAWALAFMINAKPSIIKSSGTLQALARKLDVEEIHICDEKGILRWGTVPSFYGFDFKTSAQTKPFLAALKNKNFEMAQDPQPRGVDKTLFQYITVARRDKPGIVQVGVKPERLQEELEAADMKNISFNYSVGKNGYIVIIDTKTGKILSHPNKAKLGKKAVEYAWPKILKEKSDSFEVIINGTRNYMYYDLAGDYIIGAVIPVSEFTGDLNKLLVNLIIISLLAIIMLLLLTYFNIKRIIQPLQNLTVIADQIAADNLTGEIRVIETNDEIGELSRAFKKMQGNLQQIASIAKNVALGNLRDCTLGTQQETNGDLVTSFSIMIKNLKALAEEFDKVITGVQDGKLDIRCNTTIFDGVYREIVQGMNSTLDVIMAPVKEASGVLNEIAKANMDVWMEGDYKGEHAKIKVYINSLIENFNKLLGEINVAASQVNTAAKQVSDSSQALANGSTEQAASIEEITASISEIAEQTKQNARNASQANEFAQDAKDAATRGNQQMHGMLRSMEEINNAASNIAKIIKVIDEIAFQTNILALNAAVEAARAGEHGKGFAVVAEEVRNLAARSANAAKDTTALIESSIKKAESGTKIAGETAEALDKIVSTVAKATALVEEIAIASNDQATGISQVNQAITQVAQVTETNTATAEESAASSQELLGQAEVLKNMVQKFKLKKTSKDLGAIDGLSPEMMRALEELLEQGGKFDMEQIEDSRSKDDEGKVRPKISLDDDFGKY